MNWILKYNFWDILMVLGTGIIGHLKLGLSQKVRITVERRREEIEDLVSIPGLTSGSPYRTLAFSASSAYGDHQVRAGICRALYKL